MPPQETQPQTIPKDESTPEDTVADLDIEEASPPAEDVSPTSESESVPSQSATEAPPPEPTPVSSQPESTSASASSADKKAMEDVPPSSNFIQNLLIKARAKIQERKQKKLDKIMALFNAKPKITNQDIQKLLRISRTSSFRYLDILEKQNKIKQVGNTGKAVFYSKIQ